MVLAAIINCWDGIELLRGCLNCMNGHVDHYIIVWQPRSNFGEEYNPLQDIQQATEGFENVHLIQYVPVMYKREHTGMRNEKAKRNLGLEYAKKLHSTHFLHIDVDEYYEDFGAAKQAYIDSNHHGSVVKMWTYFKKPTWRLEQPENYYAPFIHTLTQNTFVAPQYTFYVDRTRRVNQMDVIVLEGVMMHHFSWVRKDIARKCRNSSAKNLSQHLGEYETAQPGKRLAMYDQRLVEVPNIFNIEI